LDEASKLRFVDITFTEADGKFSPYPFGNYQLTLPDAEKFEKLLPQIQHIA
jgi:hypothetical protein